MPNELLSGSVLSHNNASSKRPTPPLCREQRRFAVASRNQRLVGPVHHHAMLCRCPDTKPSKRSVASFETMKNPAYEDSISWIENDSNVTAHFRIGDQL